MTAVREYVRMDEKIHYLEGSEDDKRGVLHMGVSASGKFENVDRREVLSRDDCIFSLLLTLSLANNELYTS